MNLLQPPGGLNQNRANHSLSNITPIASQYSIRDNPLSRSQRSNVSMFSNASLNDLTVRSGMNKPAPSINPMVGPQKADALQTSAIDLGLDKIGSYYQGPNEASASSLAPLQHVSSQFISSQMRLPETTDKLHQFLDPLFAQTSRSTMTLPIVERPRPEDPVMPPQLMRSIFAIYNVGIGIETRKEFAKPSGLGFLVTDTLAVTTHSVMPTEEAALTSYAQFKDGEIYKFDPYECFVTSVRFNFTVVAFQRYAVENALKFFTPIEMTVDFKLQPGEQIYFIPYDPNSKRYIINADSSSFTFSTIGQKHSLLPGTPIFNTKWILQGIHLQSTTHINRAVRIDSVLIGLNSELLVNPNGHIRKIIQSNHMGYKEKRLGRVMYYVTWYSRDLWKFDVDRDEWNKVAIRNLETIEEEDPEWWFHWNSRSVMLPNGAILILGGTSKKTQQATNDVWMYNPQRFHSVSKIKPMANAREACTAIYYNHFVYVMGGKNMNLWERFSVSSKTWHGFSSMYNNRSDASACVAGNFIFVVGGLPINTAGVTIERYNMHSDGWTLLSVNLPKGLFRHTVFSASQNRIAILGGQGSFDIYILYIQDTMWYDKNKRSARDGVHDTYKLSIWDKKLNEIVESVNAIMHLKETNEVLIINTANASGNQITPKIFTFQSDMLDFTRKQDTINQNTLAVTSRRQEPGNLSSSMRAASQLALNPAIGRQPMPNFATSASQKSLLSSRFANN